MPSVESLLATAEGQSFEPAKFKLLLSHRRLELQGGAPPGFPFLPGFNPAMFGLPTPGEELLILILEPTFNLILQEVVRQVLTSPAAKPSRKSRMPKAPIQEATRGTVMTRWRAQTVRSLQKMPQDLVENLQLLSG